MAGPATGGWSGRARGPKLATASLSARIRRTRERQVVRLRRKRWTQPLPNLFVLKALGGEQHELGAHEIYTVTYIDGRGLPELVALRATA